MHLSSARGALPVFWQGQTKDAAETTDPEVVLDPELVVKGNHLPQGAAARARSDPPSAPRYANPMIADRSNFDRRWRGYVAKYLVRH